MNKKVEKAIGKALAASLVTGVAASVAVPVSAAEVDVNQLYKTAYNAVVKAKAEGTQAAINEARTAINALKGTGAEFAVGEFSKQVDTVQGPKLVAIVKAIMKAQASGKQADINAAKALIEPELPATWRNSYSQAADLVQQALVEKVDAAVKKAQASKVQADIDAAKALVAEVKTAAASVIASWAADQETKVAAIVAETKVVSVTTTNLKEVVVTFNNKVSIDTSKPSDYFAVTSNTVAALAVSEDGKSVTLTLGTNVAQQADVEVTVKAAAGLVADYTTKVNDIDTTLPVAQSIKLTGPNTFDVTFSEPIASGTAVEIENGIYGATITGTSTDGKTVSVVLGTTLAEGNYNVKISGFKDYANFLGLTKTFTLNYVKDTTAPVVTIKSATQTQVVVEFNKAVTGLTAANFYHTYSAWQPSLVTPSADGKTYTLDFSTRYLQEGNVNVVVLKNNGTSDVVDAWGNKMAADAKLVATIVNDVTAPTVTKVEATAEDKVAVTFSEDVKFTVTNPSAYFTIKDKDGKVVTPAIVSPVAQDASNSKLYTLTLASKLAGGNYTVEVKDVVDTALSANKITTTTLGFAVTDKTAIDIATGVTANYVLDGSGKLQYIYVNYPEAVATTGITSALNKDNYLVQGAALKAEDKVELFDAKTVKITIAAPVTLTAPSSVLTVGRVADVTGNVPTAMSAAFAMTAATAPTTFTAKMVGLNKVEITFAGAKLTNVTAAAFNATKAGTTPVTETFAAATYVVNSNGDTVVTGTLKSGEALANKLGGSTTGLTFSVNAGIIKTLTGQTVGSITGVAPTDGIAPAASSVVQGTGAVIDVRFDEAIVTDALAATDLVVVDKDGKTLVAGDAVNARDYTITVTGSTLEIILTNAAYKGNITVSTKPAVTYIHDAAGNAVVSVSATTVEVK